MSFGKWWMQPSLTHITGIFFYWTRSNEWIDGDRVVCDISLVWFGVCDRDGYTHFLFHTVSRSRFQWVHDRLIWARLNSLPTWTKIMPILPPRSCYYISYGIQLCSSTIHQVYPIPWLNFIATYLLGLRCMGCNLLNYITWPWSSCFYPRFLHGWRHREQKWLNICSQTGT